MSNQATNAPKVDVTYMAKDGYAGITNKPMTDVAIKVGKGSIRYRIHVKGKGWYPLVTGYDKNDFHNGYAGDGKERH